MHTRTYWFILFASLSALYGCGGGDSAADSGSAADGGGTAADAGGGDDAGVADAGDQPFYAACADPGRQFQFPTPAWETDAASASGKVYAIPENDAAGNLLKDVRPLWAEQFIGIDGLPLNAQLFVALDAKATAVDAAQVKLYSLAGSTPFEVPAAFTVELSASRSILMIRAKRPLPTPLEGEYYILALYEGAVTGARPLPACGADGKALEKYEIVHGVLADNAFGGTLQLALPFIASRMSIEQAALYQALAAAPALEVESVAAKGLDEFGEFTPDDGTKAVLALQAYQGILNTPLYQADLGYLGAFAVDHATHLPQKQGVTKPGFLVALPKDGQAPFPVVLFQHGGGRYKQDLFTVAKPYAEAGIAMIGIDLPYHGDRSKVPGNNGSDLDMADFDHPLKTRDNFRQASADHIAVLTGIDAINTALEPLTGFLKTLDASKIFFTGHSMGSVSGSITSGVTQSLLGTSLIAGGGPYRQLVVQGLFSLKITDILDENRPAVEKELLLAFIQTLLDAGDPITYLRRYEDSQKKPMDVLVWESIGDPVVNNPATDLQAAEAGCQLAKPSNHAVDGMTEIDLPASGNFGWEGVSEKATRILVHREYPGVQGPYLHMEPFLDLYIHGRAAACFDGRLTGGVCTLEP